MITFSGIDCSGKSTQISMLCDFLKKENKKYKIVWSRPGFTPGIAFIKRLLHTRSHPPSEEAVLKNISCAEHNEAAPSHHTPYYYATLIDLWFYYSVILRIKGLFTKLLICDRYIWDAYIDLKVKYPASGFETSFWWKMTLKTMVKPDISFMLLISPEESVYRSILKHEERQESTTFRKVEIDMYIKEIEHNRWSHIIDASKSKEEVFSEIQKILKNAL